MRNGNRIPADRLWRRSPETLARQFLRLSMVASVLAFFAACATSPRVRSSDPSLPEIDVLQLKENSDEALKLAQENKLELQSLETKVQELENRISSIGDELANMPNAKVDEHSQQIALIAERLKNIEDRLAKSAILKKEMATFSPTSLDTNGSAVARKAGIKPDSGGAAASSGIPAKPGARNAAKALRKPPASDVEAQLYKKAFDLYYGRGYAQAISRFEELLQKFPASTYADNCFYWIGECQFAQGNYAKAMVAFRKVFTFPETEKADDAQLKMGYCYLRLGEKKLAAEEFKKVVSLYPDSEYSERAKEELAKLE